ncbi:protease modulator HflC [Rosistilla oblonga]|uniref:protease modulator HflC n=1 Tax=Rosistilla oblonga TaxID=2527990 RepID=UPI003A9760C5
MKPETVINLLRGLAVLAILLVLAPFFCFVIDEREMGVVMRFGKPAREKVEPGVYYKLPFVETVRRLPKTRQFWGDSRRFLLPDLPTRDDKKIELIPWAMWQIDDAETGPTTFVQRLRTIENAEERVAQICRSAIRDVITQYDLAELVRSTNRTLTLSGEQQLLDDELAEVGESQAEQMLVELEEKSESNSKEILAGRSKILDQIKIEAQRRLASKDDQEGIGRGIRLIDIGISQIAFVDSVRIKTFDRWIAERESISARNVNEGERLKAAIINETNAEVQSIEGKGQQKASETKGQADADVIKSYAEAMNEVGEFYTFVRTLEAYEKAITKDSSLILTTDSEFFGLLKKLEPLKK